MRATLEARKEREKIKRAQQAERRKEEREAKKVSTSITKSHWSARAKEIRAEIRDAEQTIAEGEERLADI